MTAIQPIKQQNKRRIVKAHHVWKHTTRPRASARWMRYVRHDMKALQEIAV